MPILKSLHIKICLLLSNCKISSYIEEFVLHGIVNKIEKPDLKLSISYFETNGVIEVDIEQFGIIANPIVNIVGELATMIIERIVKNSEFGVVDNISKLTTILE